MIQLSAMFPVLVAKDLTSLKAYYEKNFGFESQFFDADFYVHLCHPASGIQLGFMVPDHPSQPEFLHAMAGKQGMVISFEVPNAKNAYDRLKKAGLDIVFDFKVEEFGLSHFMVKDPAGFVIDIVEHHQQS